MCKASITAKKVVPAVAGQTYGIGISTHNLGAFHPQGRTVGQCVACVENATKMTFSNIPEHLQERLGVSDYETATFVDTGDNQHDLVKFDNGADAVLVELADCGVIAYIGILDVDSVIAGSSDIDVRELIAA